jgi:hypothetical protein
MIAMEQDGKEDANFPKYRITGVENIAMFITLNLDKKQTGNIVDKDNKFQKITKTFEKIYLGNTTTTETNVKNEEFQTFDEINKRLLDNPKYQDANDFIKLSEFEKYFKLV